MRATPRLLVLLVAALAHTQHARGAVPAAVQPTAAAGTAPPAGRVQLKVLGEELARPFTGFLAALMYEGKLFCGGSLVAPNAVLTAAHCFNQGNGTFSGPDGISVRLDWPDLRQTTYQGSEEHAVARIITNPAYSGTAEATGDLALLVLDTPSALPPILLPPPGLNLTKGQQVWTAGYSAEGADYGTVARWFYANAYESAACSRIWREWGKEEKNGEWNATSATLCSGLQVEGAGVCSGDSGGPLVLGEEADSLMLMGVLSWGTGDSPCAPGSYEINAWASMLDPGHRAWIDSELGKLRSAAAAAA